MNWLNNQWQKFVTKPWYGKLFDILFILIVIIILTPGGRVYYQHVLLEIGVFQTSTENWDKKTAINFNNLVVKDITNSETLNTNTLNNKVVFLNVWATWCPPCKAELPSLNNLQGKFKGNENIKFLFVSQESIDKLNTFSQSLDAQMPFYQILSSPQSLQASILPTTFIIDKKGHIVHKHEGLAKWDTEEVIEKLNTLCIK